MADAASFDGGVRSETDSGTDDVDAPGPPGPPRPSFRGPPAWTEIAFDDAADFGFDPSEVRSPRPPSPLTIRNVAAQAGLGTEEMGGNPHGVGVAFQDIDGDAFPDIFVANGCRRNLSRCWDSRLYRNVGGTAFEDVSAEWNVMSILRGADGRARDNYSIAADDFDRDGDVDLYIGSQPTDVLLRNEGNTHFVDGTRDANAGGPPSDPALAMDTRSKIVSFGDFDGDGLPDLASASSTFPPPGVYVLRNRGDGTFEDVTTMLGPAINPRGNPCAVLWTDHDDDGDADLWIWNDRGGHAILQNEAHLRFVDVTEAADDVGIAHPMGIDGADADRDLDLDYYVSNIRYNAFLSNNGDGTFVDVAVTSETRGDETQFGWGLAFEDFDSDGWYDLFVAQEDERPHLMFRNSGEVPLRYQQIAVPHAPPRDTGSAHNVPAAFADYDRDGRVDVVLASSGGNPLQLYRNETDVGDGRWLEVQVRATARIGIGIGARVIVGIGEQILFREIYGGSSRASQNELSARFGLGPYTGADWVAVLFSDGSFTTAVRVEGNRRIYLPPK